MDWRNVPTFVDLDIGVLCEDEDEGHVLGDLRHLAVAVAILHCGGGGVDAAVAHVVGAPDVVRGHLAARAVQGRCERQSAKFCFINRTLWGNQDSYTGLS